MNGGILSDSMQLPLEPQKGLYYFFTHTLLCKIGGATL